jgi:hypothetical protein
MPNIYNNLVEAYKSVPQDYNKYVDEESDKKTADRAFKALVFKALGGAIGLTTGINFTALLLSGPTAPILIVGCALAALGFAAAHDVVMIGHSYSTPELSLWKRIGQNFKRLIQVGIVQVKLLPGEVTALEGRKIQKADVKMAGHYHIAQNYLLNSILFGPTLTFVHHQCLKFNVYNFCAKAIGQTA